MVDTVLALPAETRLMILAPVVANRKGEQMDLFAELRAQGFARVRVNGAVHEIDAVPKLTKSHKHNVDVVVDRLKVRDDMRQRLAESFETALRHADGRAVALEMDGDTEHLFSARFACPVCSYACRNWSRASFPSTTRWAPAPSATAWASYSSSTRSASSSQPAPVAGRRRDPQLGQEEPVLLPDHRIAGGALRLLCRYTVRGAWRRIAPDRSSMAPGATAINFRYLNERGTRFDRSHTFEGIIPNLERRYRGSDSKAVREELAKYISNTPCPQCAGTRLRIEARHVRVGAQDAA